MRKISAFLLAALFVFVVGCTGRVKNGSVTIDSIPQGATVSIDGAAVGKTPLKNYALSFGKHEIILSMQGYESKNVEITVDSSKNIPLSLVLTKAIESYNVLIKTDEQFLIVLDKQWLGKSTGTSIPVEKGTHEIQLINYWDTIKRPYSLIGTFDINKDLVLNESDFKQESPQISEGQLFFPVQFTSDVPVIRCCSAAATTYSGIYVNQTTTLKGYVRRSTKSFYIIFPSGKKIEVATTAGNCNECANYFEKTIAFDEPGEYSLQDKDDPNAILGEEFKVAYKAKPISPITTGGEIFTSRKEDKGIVVFEGEEEKVEFLITDANDKVMRNTPIGAYGLATDSNGIATFTLSGKFEGADTYGCCGELSVNGKPAPPVLIYGSVGAELVRRKTISKKYAKTINGEIYLPGEMIASCFSQGLPGINIDDKNYVNIGDIIKNPQKYPDNAVKDNGDTITIYGQIGMVP